MGEKGGYWVYDRNPVFPKIWNSCMLNIFFFGGFFAFGALLAGVLMSFLAVQNCESMLRDSATDTDKFIDCENNRKDIAETAIILLAVSVPVLTILFLRAVFSAIGAYRHFESHPNERDTCNNVFIDHFTCLVPEARRVFVEEEEDADIVKDAKSDDSQSCA